MLRGEIPVTIWDGNSGSLNYFPSFLSHIILTAALFGEESNSVNVLIAL